MDLGAGSDNDLAWRMATETSASYDQLEPALELAERAVELTDRSDPDILDTLAEVLFVRGDVDGALRAIDEAIGLTRGEEYYVEQRRRFTGERDPDDRPPAPLLPWPLREHFREQEEFEEPGILI
jgi:tetratricopeptide (TPR) repeat protein